jgi:hypothetical protein
MAARNESSESENYPERRPNTGLEHRKGLPAIPVSVSGGSDVLASVAHNARMTRIGGRRDQVLRLVRQSHVPLDDDQAAQAAQMNRVYVNAICRQLAGTS